MKKIRLSSNRFPSLFTLVDEDTYEWASVHCWHVTRKVNGWYVARKDGNRTLYLHREIMKPPKGMEVDHIDMDGLDNRKENLRVCSHSENRKNNFIYKNNSSGFKGVSWNKRTKKWIAYIRTNGKQKYLGLFDEKEAAALAYDKAAKDCHGDYARPNSSERP